MATWESRVLCNETYVSGGAENYSNVTITFQIRRVDYNMIGNNNYGNAYYSISCNGQSSGNKYLNFDWGWTAPGTWWTVGSHSFKVPHNSDGSKSISFSGYFYTAISPSSFSASGSKTLTKIPRYPNITSFKVDSTTQTSAIVSWKADSTCDALQYSFNKGAWVATSGATFTINDLSPGTKYELKIKVRRKDSQLWKESGSLTFETVPIVSISTTPISFNIGGTLTLSFLNHENNSSFLRLYQKDKSNEWMLITEVSDIQAESYTWDLSEFANNMYANTPNSNQSEVRIDCGTEIGKKEYLNSYLGIANVVNSNPVLSDFSFSNTDTKTNEMFKTSNDFITYFGNLKVDIQTKAVPKNASKISYYNIGVSNGDLLTIKKIDESTNDISVQFDTFTTSGTYRVAVEAVDTRGNISESVTKEFNVYNYHTPTASITLERINRFEKETSLTITAFISRVTKENNNKNNIIDVKYRFREAGGSWSEYESISTESKIENNDIKIIYSNSIFKILESNKSYDFEFVIQDKIQSVPFTGISVGQGIPIASILDNGKVLINEVPSDKNINNKNSLIVGSDITIKDADGVQRGIFAELKRLIILSINEPEDQMDGGLWIEENE